ncbi:hypothetical protein SAMN05216276_100326 [Streptosporangium subroseum]|uniref:Nuclear transport factor 2 family protein n=1 Tax=Streptosporangium subroseum TaxID=106412 RepID=A0A239BA08_9ACTN|nr:hypothetical protein [Streptosporangium subroseum]SNS04034.1 hypothetical protein SAMN05216276_100326 [Streptosporangium subroseum]
MRSIRLLFALTLVISPVGLVAGCGTCGEDVEVQRVAPSPEGASPVEVVRAYFQALAAHDKETGQLMWDHRSPQYEAEFGGVASPFANWTSLTDVKIGQPEPETCGDVERCVRVKVNYTFEQCEFYTGDDGAYGERFFLDRIDGRWLINGHGQG